MSNRRRATGAGRTRQEVAASSSGPARASTLPGRERLCFWREDGDDLVTRGRKTGDGLPLATAAERQQAGWSYVVEAANNGAEPAITAADGRLLSRRAHGRRARIEVCDESSTRLPVAALLRAAAAAGRALEGLGDDLGRPLEVRLGPAGTAARVHQLDQRERVDLDGVALAAAGHRHAIEAQLVALLAPGAGRRAALPIAQVEPAPCRVLLFESPMSSPEPHNDREIAQGVLHMLGAISDSPVEPVLCRLKMPVGGADHEPDGLDAVAARLDEGPVALVCLTLLEDYFPAARRLIAWLRARGSRAQVAVGGVMPSLTPEQVAAHLPGVSFVCRGAGEYFLPPLCRVAARKDVDTPWGPHERALLLGLDGLLAIDQAGRRLIAANWAHTVQVADLDAAPLDLSYLERRHVEGGIEISTARGCLHHCTFCSILGRGSYQARSPASVQQLLSKYRARLGELYQGQLPPSAYRVHISDDDFACNPERAAAILELLSHTPFRLSSLQLSIADLLARERGQLTTRLHPSLAKALLPKRFADSTATIAPDERYADYRHRGWSSYLQIGIESFCDRELARLGKGYRVAHVRAAVAELALRDLHLDAYFIVSNSATTAADLVASLQEIARLKLRHPLHFHLRHPAVRRLVSYFPSHSHRLKVRRGQADTMVLRETAHVEGYPELDYPFVDHDTPSDVWVRYAAEHEIVDDAGRYTASLTRLATLWRQRLDTLAEHAERRQGERLIRRLDDAPRALAFELLNEALGPRRTDPPAHERTTESKVALNTVEDLLGPQRTWIGAFRRYRQQHAPRLVVIPTWECELRCRYCYIPKQAGRVMTERTLERSIDLLLSSRRRQLMLQFFGGEPLVRYPLLQHAIRYATERAAANHQELSFIVSSNGYSLDESRLQWLAEQPMKLELSLDGAPDTQNRYRQAPTGHGDSYTHGIAPRVEAINASAVPYDVIMVVHPSNVEQMAANFAHIADLGFMRIQVNIGLGARWSKEHKRTFAEALERVGKLLRERAETGRPLSFVNAENKPHPMRLNGEVTVDYDGTIYGGNGFLHENEHKHRFRMGHLDDLRSFDRYSLDAPDNDFLLQWTYPPDITANNIEVGRIMCSFVGWLHREGLAPARA